MAFTVRDYQDLVELLIQHPEWQIELRRLLLADDFLMLPTLVRELTEAQKASEERLSRLEATVAKLAEAQKASEERLSRLEATVAELVRAQARTEQQIRELAQAQRASEERLSRLEATVAELATTVAGLVQAQKAIEERLSRLEATVAELATTVAGLVQAQKAIEERLSRLEVIVAELAQAQVRTEQQLSELAAAQRRTEQSLAALADAHRRTSDIVNQLLGRDLERKYRERAGSYFGKWLKPVEVIPPNDLREALEERLSEDEVDEVMLVDVLIRGRLRHVEHKPEIWLVLEVSHVIDRYDVDRAQKRAALLRKAGYRAIPVVAGERMLEECEGPVQVDRVAVFLDGRPKYWERAIEAALGAEEPSD